MFVEYYCNGTKKREYYYIGQAVSGKMVTWYENGTIQLEAYFNEYRPIGLWKYYDANGKLIKTEKYNNGELIETKEFDE